MLRAIIEVGTATLLAMVLWRLIWLARVGKYWKHRCHNCLVQYPSWDGFVTVGETNLCRVCKTEEIVRSKVPGFRGKFL